VSVWPPSEEASSLDAQVELGVSDGGERLGSITVEMPAGRPLRPADHRLLADLADQAGMAFRHAQLTAELSGRVAQLDRRTGELTASRRRLISAADAERSRLEQAIAQQVLPHLAPLPNRLRNMSKRQAGALTAQDAATIKLLIESSTTALEALRQITRGVFPAQLGRSGLSMALTSLLARPASSGQLVVDGSAAGRRFPPEVEAAAYFCVVEAMRDLTGPVLVELGVVDEHLQLVVSGRDLDGLPFDQVRDRVEAAGGRVSIVATDGHAVIDVRAPSSASVALV
jgi:signal transduction histidine kinase